MVDNLYSKFLHAKEKEDFAREMRLLEERKRERYIEKIAGDILEEVKKWEAVIPKQLEYIDGAPFYIDDIYKYTLLKFRHGSISVDRRYVYDNDVNNTRGVSTGYIRLNLPLVNLLTYPNDPKSYFLLPKEAIESLKSYFLHFVEKMSVVLDNDQ